MIEQLYSGSDERLQMIEHLQSDIDERRESLEKLRSDFDNCLQKVSHLIENQQLGVKACDMSKESSSEPDLEMVLESLNSLTDKFVRGDW